MPRDRKAGQHIPTPSLGVSASIVTIVPSATRTYTVSKDLIRALTDESKAPIVEPLEGPDLFDGTKVSQTGISFDNANAYKLFSVLLQKLADTIKTIEGEAVQVSSAATAPAMLRIDNKSYPQPCVQVTEYELVKAMFGTTSGQDYNDFNDAFRCLRDTPHKFSMQLKTGSKDKKGKPLYEVTITSSSMICVTYQGLTVEEAAAMMIEGELEDTPMKKKQRGGGHPMKIYFHPITIHTLAERFAQIPKDLEKRLKELGAGRSPYIRLLSLIVIGEKDQPLTRHRGYFELNKEKLVKKLKLEGYSTRPKDLEKMLDTAFRALGAASPIPWLIRKVEQHNNQKGAPKYRIYPEYEQEPDPVKRIGNGAA